MDIFDEFDDISPRSNFDLLPSGLSDFMLAQWNNEREKINNSKYLDEKFYHRFRNFNKWIICGGAAYYLSDAYTSYEPILENLLANISINGNSGKGLVDSIFAALFVPLLVNAGLGFSAMATSNNYPYAEKERKNKLKNKELKAIYKLWKSWVEKGLIDEENKPWCLIRNEQYIQLQKEDVFEKINKLKCRITSKFSKKYNKK